MFDHGNEKGVEHECWLTGYLPTQDYTMGFALTVLTTSLAVGQFFRQVIALQWIFGFSIMAALFVLSAAVALPEWAGVRVSWPSYIDAERAPLLAEQRTEEER
jgi:hypothetical protein